MKRIVMLIILALLLCDIASFADAEGIDYLALVNKLNPLPEGWEDALETVHITNSVGDDVEVEAEAYAAYELLRADLMENDGIEMAILPWIPRPAASNWRKKHSTMPLERLSVLCRCG